MSMSIREALELIWLRLVVTKRNAVEYGKVVWKYYGNAKFRKLDWALLLGYVFHGPYKISKDFLMQRGEKDIHVYGETPLTTLDAIAAQCQLKSSDVVFELGCGRGRTCFWLNSFIGCRTVGIEHIPEFVVKAQHVKEKYNVEGVEFYLGDIRETDLSQATVIYLYGTCYEDAFIQKLIQKFAKLPAGTKIITVSYPLTDYTSEPTFEVMKRFNGAFTWGEGDVYLQIRK